MTVNTKRIAVQLFAALIFYGLGFPAKPVQADIIPEDQSAAVILAYHRIGENAYPENNLRIDQFQSHINEILHGDYNVMKLDDVIDALESHKSLPPRTIALTFEGAFLSAYQNAIPLLLENDIPFTVFYVSDLADRKDPNHMGWSALKKLSRNLNVSLGILPASYDHVAYKPESEIRRLINKAKIRYREEFRQEPHFISYPFGEYSAALQDIIKMQNFQAAFGLHSGASYAGADLLALPRFSMTESYGDLGRFKIAANALPLPVTDIEPDDPKLSTSGSQIGFTVSKALQNKLSALSCYISGQSKPELEILGTRVEIRAQEPLTSSRTRINCTLPKDSEAKNWRWFGMLLHRQDRAINQEQPALQ
jgi:peptidoglycan/xylan/chitin deacetylase (PgdA/CDA1 family)